jgi:hypothetical protein
MNPTNQTLSNLKAITVLGDGETWTSLRNTKVILMSKDFEYEMICDANDLYDESLLFSDGTHISSLIVEELSIQSMVEFYLANRK